MGSKVLLIHGAPRAGKTPLVRDQLVSRGWQPLHVDDLYVNFVRDTIPQIFMPDLYRYIAGHYERVLKEVSYSLEHYGRDFFKEWSDHLVSTVVAEAQRAPLLSVEWAYLNEFHALIRNGLQNSGTTQVHVIETLGEQQYRIDRRLVDLDGLLRSIPKRT